LRHLLPQLRRLMRGAARDFAHHVDFTFVNPVAVEQ